MSSVQNKEMIMKITRKNNQAPYKRRPIKIIADFQMENMKNKELDYSSTSFEKPEMPGQTTKPAKPSVIIKGERNIPRLKTDLRNV